MRKTTLEVQSPITGVKSIITEDECSIETKQFNPGDIVDVIVIKRGDMPGTDNSWLKIKLSNRDENNYYVTTLFESEVFDKFNETEKTTGDVEQDTAGGNAN